MSFSLMDCGDCGPTMADYVGLAIAAVIVVVPRFLWWSARAKRALEDAKGFDLTS